VNNKRISWGEKGDGGEVDVVTRDKLKGRVPKSHGRKTTLVSPLSGKNHPIRQRKNKKEEKRPTVLRKRTVKKAWW